MKKSKRWFRSSAAFAVALSLARAGWAGHAVGGPYVLTKDVWGASGGTPMSGSRRTLMGSAGEPLSGSTLSNAPVELHSGYLSGYTGAAGSLRLVSFKVGSTTAYFEDGIPVGVPLDAPIELTFSGALQPGSLPAGIQPVIRLDHLAQTRSQTAPVTYRYDASRLTVTLLPDERWAGNTFYDVTISPELQDQEGFAFPGTAHVSFVTVLDPQVENVVLRPLPADLAPMPLPHAPGASQARVTMNIPSQALSEFSLIRVNPDPLNAPLRVDPEIIREASRKASTASGGYAAPVVLKEINGFNLQGRMRNTLSRPATLSVSFNGEAASRPGAVSLWALDEEHKLWVKLPSSRFRPGSQTVEAAMGRFSVFALMTMPVGSAADSLVFPTPWRPHGPNAGDGPGQTGTEQGGLTFSNLPSECAIRIYTLSGSLVRELHHSDLAGTLGQARWDGLTRHGERTASGVYLWRVESSDDGKSGKLMIIQ